MTEKGKAIEESQIGEVVNEIEDKEYTVGYTQYLIDGDKFIPVTETVGNLPPGDYDIKFDRIYDKVVLAKRVPKTEKLIRLPMREFDEVLNDIATFWKSRGKYDEYGYIYKRGILLFGAPGNGKSSLISLMSQELIHSHGGVVINICNVDDIFSFSDIMRSLREIEPERKIIAIIEDIDNYVGENSNHGNPTLSTLLNILDGKMQLDNIVIIATTNYPEMLEERISNRPSRFDLRREIGAPKMRSREFYLRTKLKQRDLKKLDMEKTLADTRGFTIDHLKELVCLIFVHGHKYENALAEVRSMIKNPMLKNTPSSSDKKLGFATRIEDDDDDRK